MRNDAKFLYPLLVFLLLTTTSFLNSATLSADSHVFGGWVKLGKQVVGEGVSYETLAITDEKEGIKRLKLKVQKTSVYLVGIKVIYTDGTSENHTIRRRLEKGDSTRAFDLIGHHRTIQKIMFNYGKAGRGGAQLSVLAKQ